MKNCSYAYSCVFYVHFICYFSTLDVTTEISKVLTTQTVHYPGSYILFSIFETTNTALRMDGLFEKNDVQGFRLTVLVRHSTNILA